MERAQANPLLSTQKSSDSSLQPVLHPLVLLTISDYITRHTLREQPGPIIGALIGQQNGREVTIEHAFECAIRTENDKVVLDDEWFTQRLQQMKTIHTSPQLDFVGWYTLFPRSGPTPSILAIHDSILSKYNESSLLLGFHSEESIRHDAGSRLPISIYESNYEADEWKNEEGEDNEMHDVELPLQLKFRELPYCVETGEAEMISMDFVAKGAGNATAVEPREQKTVMPGNTDDPKGKRKMKVLESAADNSSSMEGEAHYLGREDEEMIAALTAKANSIKMLHSRIKLLVTYLERLPPSHLTGDDTTMVTGEGDPTTPSHTILRSIQALVNRLSLVVPSANTAFEEEMLSEANDVHLMELLNGVLQSTVRLRALGKIHDIVESTRNQNKKHLDDSKALGSRFAEI